jgi:CMP/dCMP kinase
MKTSIDIAHVRNITVSGRIGTGTTTLAKGLAEYLGWELLEGGELFAKVEKELHIDEADSHLRPDTYDLEYEEKIKAMLRTNTHTIIQSHLAGFDAQGIDGVFKIVTLCIDDQGQDKTELRIDRIVNRKQISVEQAKYEVRMREERNLEKWRRLYAENDPTWVYWDTKYFDLVVNTYRYNQQESVSEALKALGITQS